MDGYGVEGDAESVLDWDLRHQWPCWVLDHDRSQPESEVSIWYWCTRSSSMYHFHKFRATPLAV